MSQIQIDGTTHIMKENIEIETKADTLVDNSQRFHKIKDKRFLVSISIFLLFFILVIVLIFSKK